MKNPWVYFINHEKPYLAILGKEQQNSKIDWICGASLVSEKFLLTSARCLE